jgi:hypothetical protein
MVYKCGDSDAVKLPSDETLKTWEPAQIFAWGEASWKWGDSCSKQVDFDRHMKKCLKGDKLECTYVNQHRLKVDGKTQ